MLIDWSCLLIACCACLCAVPKAIGPPIVSRCQGSAIIVSKLDDNPITRLYNADYRIESTFACIGSSTPSSNRLITYNNYTLRERVLEVLAPLLFIILAGNR